MSRLRPAVAALAGCTLVVALTLAPRPAQACGCGIAIDATVSQERGLVIEAPGRERIVLSLDLTSDGTERAAVVLPVPARPTVEAVARRRPAGIPRPGHRPAGGRLGGAAPAMPPRPRRRSR